MVGYFIRLGDKTSCGGVVTGSDTLMTMMGIEHSREGDSVTCGVTGLTYQIEGGVSFIKSSGLRVAGTLDSISGCPCKATLHHTWIHTTYENETPAGTSFQAPAWLGAGSSFAEGGRASGLSGRTATAQLASGQDPAQCSGCFQLVNQRELPCGLNTYVLLQDGERISESQLNGDGLSPVGTSRHPISTQVALSAPSPVLE